MKRIKFISTILILASCWSSCKKEGRIDHIDSKAPAPAQITDIKVEERQGGAVINYKIPDDPNFSYAKAVYEIQPGVFREAKASLYTDTLLIVGYGDTLTHEVKLYSVGKNEKESAPFSINITPLRPPLQTTFETMGLNATFGGVQISFQNAAKADLAVELMVDTTGHNTWKNLSTFYTAAPEGNFSVRGMDTLERKFAAFVRDRWNNKSDTLIRSLTPIFEELIPKDKWKAVHLPTDTWQPSASTFALEYLWDGSINNYTGIFASSNASVLPQWFTIDLGQKVIISRIREHQQQSSHLYAGSAIKKFELWGSNNPSPDGGWASWELLGTTFNSFKPSGLPMGSVSAEDKNYAWFLGEEFGFDHLLPAVRYIRWKTLETYGSAGQIVCDEIDLYGRIE